jgi:hypothetical protein
MEARVKELNSKLAKSSSENSKRVKQPVWKIQKLAQSLGHGNFSDSPNYLLTLLQGNSEINLSWWC